MQRDAHSHKGENGKVAIIGGSRHIHGAPIFSALAAELSGIDLVFLSLPSCHEEVAKQHSLNFQVHAFDKNELGNADVNYLLEMLAIMDCAVIGPGLSRGQYVMSALEKIVTGCPCPLVLDATALQSDTMTLIQGKTAVLTPHLGELERLGLTPETMQAAAQEAGITIHLKGETDLIAGADGEMRHVQGGNAGLTVGGTGDALAGLIAGLIAQKVPPLHACIVASTIIKRAGESLFERKKYAYTAGDVIKEIPEILRSITLP